MKRSTVIRTAAVTVMFLPSVLCVAAFAFFDGMYAALTIVISVILHESAHVIAMRIFGGSGKITAVGGGFMLSQTKVLPYSREIAVLAAGPLANLTVALIIYFATLPDCAVFDAAFRINLSLALINLLPIKTVDGGRITEILLRCVFMLRTADFISDIVSAVFIFSTAFFALYLLLRCGEGVYMLYFASVCFSRHFLKQNC